MHPGLEDIQQALNKATQFVLDISKGVYQWGQDREKQCPHKEKEQTKKHASTLAFGNMTSLYMYMPCDYMRAYTQNY